MSGVRGQFTTRAGFILAAAGSAVGLGNIWKFPYLAGQNGGGAFLIIYLGFILSIGLSVMLAEFAIGRRTKRNPVGAFRHLKGGAWTAIGVMGVFTGFIILSFYSVVGGWTVAYAVKSATGLMASGDAKALGAAFGAFIGDPVEPIIYHALFMLATIAVVARGIDTGIERTCRVLMPVLFILLVVLCVRSLTLPGAAKGVAFFLSPDFSKVDGAMITAALGHAFFSLSLGMGTMITYGSYLARTTNLPGAALWVTSLDTLIAVMAGFMILPAVFAFGFDPGAGPGLTFITLPAVFSKIPFGAFFGVLFFVLLAVAALTSAISLIEVVVAYLVDEKGIARPKAALSSGIAIFLLGIPSSLSLGIWNDYTVAGKGFFDAMDYLASNILLPTGGIFISLFVGWVVFDKVMDGNQGGIGDGFRYVGLWRIICRYIAPLAIAWVLISGL
ncbi:MAG: sodium-dependent transporter [Proteobacteria bacterium]|nr:sodium-dependent transporter [Pseudomonadota bacterium]MDA1021924.1 sodium-dependent transporter [Pseudomonadota bacterium]